MPPALSVADDDRLPAVPVEPLVLLLILLDEVARAGTADEAPLLCKDPSDVPAALPFFDDFAVPVLSAVFIAVPAVNDDDDISAEVPAAVKATLSLLPFLAAEDDLLFFSSPLSRNSLNIVEPLFPVTSLTLLQDDGATADELPLLHRDDCDVLLTALLPAVPGRSSVCPATGRRLPEGCGIPELD